MMPLMAPSSTDAQQQRTASAPPPVVIPDIVDLTVQTDNYTNSNSNNNGMYTDRSKARGNVGVSGGKRLQVASAKVGYSKTLNPLPLTSNSPI
jgi:hypothetical protein